MKIAKQRLKEIIKEELSAITERVATVPQVQQMATAAGVRLSYGDAKTLAARTPAERGALEALQKALQNGSWKRLMEELGEMDLYSRRERAREADAARDTMSVGADIEGYPEPEEDEDPMASRLGTREEQLLSRILSRAVVDRYDSLEDLAADLGIEMTSDMARYIGSLKANPMYGSSGVEEGKVSGHRSEVTYSKEKRGKSKKPEKKAYNKADRAQAKRDLKK